MGHIVAVRHGETDWNREKRMQGWAPVPLNGTGREQAAATGRWLAEEYEFDRVRSSDLLRARETAEILCESVDAEPAFEPAWRERGMGVYQGLTLSDIESRFPEFGLDEAAYRATEAVPEGGESLREVEERAIEGFSRSPTSKGDASCHPRRPALYAARPRARAAAADGVVRAPPRQLRGHGVRDRRRRGVHRPRGRRRTGTDVGDVPSGERILPRFA